MLGVHFQWPVSPSDVALEDFAVYWKSLGAPTSLGAPPADLHREVDPAHAGVSGKSEIDFVERAFRVGAGRGSTAIPRASNSMEFAPTAARSIGADPTLARLRA